MNNLRANGTPNRGSGGDGRQWQCQACQKWVNERHFTFLYRRRLSLSQVGQVLQAVAEGLSYEAAGRIFKNRTQSPPWSIRPQLNLGNYRPNSAII